MHQKLATPRGLAALYPYPSSRSIAAVLAAAGVILLLTSAAVWQRQRRPYLLAGWAWFVITLLPTSGLVQAGPQAMADRYSYVPSIGLGVAVVWLAADALPANLAIGSGLTATLLLAILARRQVGFWSDTDALRQRILAVSSGDATVHEWLGVRAEAANQFPEAEAQLDAAVRLNPADPTRLV